MGLFVAAGEVFYPVLLHGRIVEADDFFIVGNLSLQFGDYVGFEIFEGFPIRRAYRFHRVGGNFERVDGRPVLPDAEIEVRAGRCSGTSDVSYRFALRYPFANGYSSGVSLQVQVA